MAFNWPEPELTVSGKVGIGTDTPSQKLEVIGDISARNLNLKGSLTIDKNLAVGGNFQLGTLSINAFSSDGNLADNSNLAVPTEQAVKTYVDNQISTRAALNGAANQDFSSKNLSVSGNLQVSGNLEVQGDLIARDTEHIAGNVSLGDQDSDEVKITGVIRSGHSSGSLRIDDALHTTGSLTVDGSLSVRDAIATANVGIGTNSPRAKLHIYSPGSNDALKISNPQVNKNARMGVDQLGVFIEPSEDDSSIRLNANPRSLGIVIRGTNGHVGIGTADPTQALDMGGRKKNLKFDYAHIGETGSGAATIIANKARVSETENNRVDYSHSNRDGVSAIELFYTNGISFFTKPTDNSNPTVEGEQFFSYGDRTYERMRISSNGNVGIGTTNPEANLHVIGKLLGAAQDTSGTALRICCGKTPEGSTNWQRISGGGGIYVDVDTSACGFQSTPIYLVNMHGNGDNWETTGGSTAYDRTNQGFRIYVRFPSDRGGRPNLTPDYANSKGWHIQWLAIGN
ncbi:hypothetical protein [Moorena producens]|uniref:hypothetical protein n=1 Tax=Moorena producens TaxID=1155739 RepID=UPI003C72FFF2